MEELKKTVGELIGITNKASDKVKVILKPITDLLLKLSNWTPEEIDERMKEYADGKRDPLSGKKLEE